jgi:sortase A
VQSTKNSKLWPAAVRGLELGLLVTSLILFGLYAKRRVFGSLESHQALRDFAVAGQRDLQALEHIGPIDDRLWSPGRIKAYRDRRNDMIPSAIGVLRIPKIHLEVPMFDGTGDAVLDSGVGRILGTSWPGTAGNIGIAGHRDGFFRGLKDVGVGDRLELLTQESAQTFVVDRIEIVDPSDVGVLQSGDTPSITLVTCYPFYFVGHAPQRYIVEGTLSHQVPMDGKKNLGSANP